MTLPVDKKWLYQSIAVSRRMSPFLIIMMGLSGSGKSTASRMLSQTLHVPWLCADVIRKRLYGLSPEQSSKEIKEDIYSMDAHKATFSQLAILAGVLLSEGYPVIIDSAALRMIERQQFIAVAKAAYAPYVIIHCHTSEDILITRLVQRLNQYAEPSEATVDIIRQQKKWLEAVPIQSPEYISLKTSEPHWHTEILKKLKQQGIF